MRIKIVQKSPGDTPVFAKNGEILDSKDGIKEFRRERNLSTSKLAEICGVSRRTVEGWEGGKNPSKAALTTLMNIPEEAIEKYSWNYTDAKHCQVRAKKINGGQGYLDCRLLAWRSSRGGRQVLIEYDGEKHVVPYNHVRMQIL